MKTEQHLPSVIDRRLSGLKWTRSEAVRRQLMTTARPAGMLRLRPAMVLLMAMLLLAGVALAVTLHYSRGYGLSKRGAEALYRRYGLDEQALGLFYEYQDKRQDGSTLLRYEPVNLQPERTGRYEVLIRGDQASASWSHDKVDAAMYADGSLSAPAWGEKQLKAYLALKAESRQAEAALNPDNWATWTLAEKAALAERQQALNPDQQPGLMHVLPGQEDVQPEEALRLALQAVADKYGVDVAKLSSYQQTVDFQRDQQTAQRAYRFQWTSHVPELSAFVVQIASPGGQVLSCSWNTRGSSRSLPEGPLDGYREAAREYLASEAFLQLSPGEKALLQQRITKAGHGDLLPSSAYVLPGKGLVPETEARVALHHALEDAFRLNQAGLDLFLQDMSLRQEGSQLLWQLRLLPKPVEDWPLGTPPLGEYTASLDARTGKWADVRWSLQGGNGSSLYTQQGFLKAKAYEGYMLPWFQALVEGTQAIKHRYAQDVRHLMSVQDDAAHDALMRAAGGSPAMFPHGLPAKGAIQQEDARRLADQALIQELKVAQTVIDQSIVYPEYLIDTSHSRNDTGQDVWSFTYHGQDGIRVVLMDAMDGSLLLVMFDSAAAGNG